MSRFLAIDFEGGGTNPQNTCPTQLGVAVMCGEEVEAEIEIAIAPPLHYKTGKPTREVSAYALRVQGRTLEEVEGGYEPSEACRELRSFAERQRACRLPVYAYNSGYDLPMYRELLFLAGCYDRSIQAYRAYPEILLGSWTDAYALARLILNGKVYSFKLDDVADYFGLARTGEAHGALEDAILCGKIASRLLAEKGAAPGTEPDPFTEQQRSLI